jgi:hypothetical protein
VAEQIAQALRGRHGRHIQAIGVHGSLAHGDDTDASNVDLVLVTKYPGTGPPPGTRRIDGIIIDLGVISADEYLRHARTLTTSWPLMADQYITTRGLHDPDAWFPRLRDTHLSRLARAEQHLFAALAREAWCRASSAHTKASRLAEWYETDIALAMLGEARLGVALVEGLMTRTYFRNTADAVARAGVAGADMHALAGRLRAQAAELAKVGRPVDGGIEDLLC